ncbi:unnamed protein product [Closterium sp. NIES-54]
MKSAGNESESRDDRFPGHFFFMSTQALAGPEKNKGFEEPAAVGKVTLHSLDYWVIDSGATYSMTPRADLLTELEPSPVTHVTSALGQRAEVKGMGKAMFKGADGKMVGLKNVLWVPNLAANLISVRRLQKAGMDTSSKGAKTYTARLCERLLWDLHKDRDVYNEMWQIPVVPMPKERQVAASISTKGEAVGSGDDANGRAKEMKSKKCNLGGTSKLGEHEESGAAAQKQHKGEENPRAAAEEEYGENMWGTIASAAFSNPTSATGECDWLTLHRRMGHVALPILQQLVKNEMVAGIRVKGEPDEVPVEVYEVWPWEVEGFLGMAQNSKGWLLWDPSTKKFLVSRDCKFMENLMYKDWKAENEAKIGMRFGEVKGSGLEHVELPLELSSGRTTTRQSSLVNGEEETKDAEEEEEEVQQVSERAPTLPSRTTSAPRIRVTPQQCQGLHVLAAEEEGRGKRRTQAPNRLTYEALGRPAKSALVGVALIVGDDEESDYDECAFVFFSPVEMPGEPATLKEALESSDAEEWKKTMESELKSIEENGTWELVELPEGRKAITSKWLFKIKSDADGKIERYKSRLVEKGYQQKEKVDYKEFFSPVVKPTTLRTLLAGATIKGWVVKQIDVTTAFLNGVLEEEIISTQSEGYDDGSGRVLRLKKALYGLKQAPRQWYLKLRGVLEEIGFTPSSADHSLFMLGEGEQRSFMVVYVDEILIFSPSSDLVKEVMLKLKDKFKCKALGDVSFYLGLHIERDVEKRCMRVHQRKYLEALAAIFGQSEGHVATPFPSGFKCVKGPEEESVGEEERRRFHSLVGSLMYAAVNTRPDVAAGMRVAKYLGQTPTVGLQYSAAAQRRQKGVDGVEPGRLFLTAFSDASYASQSEDMTSVGGFVFCVGGGPTAWWRKKQVDQALSSVESEYMALFRAVREIVWQRRLLAELGEEQQGPTPLYCDSHGAISLAKNPVLHGLTKHMGDLPVLRLHSDRGGEFSSDLSQEFFHGEGILQSFTLPDSPQQNGIVERRIGLVMEVACASMIYAAAPHFQWPFAVWYAAQKLNLWPCVSLPETSPTVRWTGEVRDASVSRAFVRDTSADKLSARAIPCDVMFDELVPLYRLFLYRSTPPPPPPLFLALGSPLVDPLPPKGPAPSGVSQVDPLLGTVPVEVAVDSGAAQGAVSWGAASGCADPGGLEPGGAVFGGAESMSAEPGGAQPAGVECGGAEPAGVEPGGAEPRGTASSGVFFPATVVTAPLLSVTLTVVLAPVGVPVPTVLLSLVLLTCMQAKFTRDPFSSSEATAKAPLDEVVMDVVGPLKLGAAGAEYFLTIVDVYTLPAPPDSSLPANPVPEADRARAASPTVSRLLATVVIDPSFESTVASALIGELVDITAACRLAYATVLIAESKSVSPPSVRGECALRTDVLEDRQEDFECLAAESFSQWQAAMGTEMASWKSTGTYVNTVPPSRANIVDGMWIFWVKRPLGSSPAFKARYVARGFSQRQGVDFFQTSPTLKMTTCRVLVHVAAQCDYELHSLDFSTAFLQGSLHEEIWLCHPPGFIGSFLAGTRWSLRRPVYGLRQVPREWHDTLRTTLAALGFAPSTSNPSLFLRTDTSMPPFYVLVYVDDLVFATADTEALTLVNSELQKRHTCTDLGALRSYLGLQITRDRARLTITLTQSHIMHQVLQLPVLLATAHSSVYRPLALSSTR